MVVTTPTNKTKPMKIPSTTTFAALVALTAHPAAFAQDEAEPILPEIAICDIFPREEILIEEPVIIVCPGEDEWSIMPVMDPPRRYEEAVTEEEIVSELEVISEETTDGEVVEINPEEGEGVVTVGGWPVGGVPIEWIKRGGGELDNLDIYSVLGKPVLQNVTGGPSTANTESTGGSAARLLNQGETAAEIEGAVTGSAGLGKAAKKSTVAIVKQGRVFLR